MSVSSLLYSNTLNHCSICPHECGNDRESSNLGYCGTSSGFSISSIVIHRGEEPVISGNSGICNIFFTGCNLKCIYCQNHQISRANSTQNPMQLSEIIEKIAQIMNLGINIVGFVSSAHVVPQVIAIIEELHRVGLYPVIVYNTNAYEKTETIKKLEGLIDVYLPDFKYYDPSLSKSYSGAADYFEYASKAIIEMYRQKGSTLFTNDPGQAERGLLIRHLVLPNHSSDSIKILKFIAEEISTGVHLSLMSQYFPADKAIGHPKLGRSLQVKEYQLVVDEMHKLGFRNGWVQEIESNHNFRPDFNREKPFI